MTPHRPLAPLAALCLTTICLTVPGLADLPPDSRHGGQAPVWRGADAHDGAGLSDLHRAVRFGDWPAVLEALAGGADPAAADAEGVTPLHLAAIRGDTAIVRLLLDAGADARTADRRGRTALHFAAQSGTKDVYALLLERGGAVNARDARGDTPLHAAARLARTDALHVLLAAGAEVDAANDDGQTALHVLGTAARDEPEVDGQVVELALVLIAAGADPQRKDVNGTQAWPRAEEPGGGRTPPGYPTTTDVANALLNYANTYPLLCERHLVGTSVQGRQFFAAKISDNVGIEEDEPEFKWVANMHGDEVTGLVMCLNMIDYLLVNYGVDPRVTNLVDEVEIWIVPTMNPDGYTLNRRENANWVDLNRDFPEGSGSNPDENTTTGRAAETAAIMTWVWAHSFTHGGNFHGGALVANYPFDNDGMGSTFSPTPDEDLFVYVAEQYSYYNPPMWNSAEFYHGITNGAAWYSIDGGMQDWNYRYEGCNDITFEIGTKTPPYSQMPTYWSQNRDSMLAYMETCLIGVRGRVTDADTGAPLDAVVTVVGRDHPIYTDPDVGDYHRMLMPGTYQLRFEAAGYDPMTAVVTVNSGPATVVDVPLGPPPQLTYPNGGETLYVDTPVTITWTGSPLAQFQVQATYNFGAVYPYTDGFESGVFDPAYSSGGSLPWQIVGGTVHSGTKSARAGAITHNQISWLTRTADAGPLSFWYKVSSEPNYDWFNFYIDGVQTLHRSGNVNWTYYATTLGPGPHELKWQYSKDGSANGGSDTVWIDDLSLTGDATTWSDVVAATPVGATSCAWTPAQATSAGKVRLRATYGAGVFGAWDESDASFVIAEAPAWPPGDMNCSGALGFDDINPFVLALTDPAAWALEYPGCPLSNGDVSGNGSFGFEDINPFVALLAGGAP